LNFKISDTVLTSSAVVWIQLWKCISWFAVPQQDRYFNFAHLEGKN